MLRLAMDYRDTTLPQMVRNLIGDSEYKGEGKSCATGERENRLNVGWRVAREIEEQFDKFGFVVPYYGHRPGAITHFIPPQRHRFSAQYNLELGADFASMYGPEVALQELTKVMAAEIIVELDQMLSGRDVLFCPCICPLPQAYVDAVTFQPTISFHSIHYLVNAKSITSFMRYFSERAPEIRNHEPSEHFIKNILPIKWPDM